MEFLSSSSIHLRCDSLSSPPLRPLSSFNPHHHRAIPPFFTQKLTVSNTTLTHNNPPQQPRIYKSEGEEMTLFWSLSEPNGSTNRDRPDSSETRLKKEDLDHPFLDVNPYQTHLWT
ncbi:hypothetical protein V6N13_122333 [Hibiscus sabdariffa]